MRKTIFLVLLFCLQPVQFLSAQTQIDQVKAAYLLNFAKYVEWPADLGTQTSKQFNFCIAGSKDQLQSYKALEKKTLNDKTISVNLTERAEDITACHVVLLTDGKGQEISKDVIRVAQGRPILIVSDAGDESMIYLFEEEGRIKFNVNLVKAQGSGLNFRSQMLQLASQVKN